MDLLVRRVPRMTLRQFGLSLIKSTTMANLLQVYKDAEW